MLNKESASKVGLSFEELSFEEMMKIQGSGDVKPEITPVVTVTASTVACAGAAATVSSVPCASMVTGTVGTTGAIVTKKMVLILGGIYYE